MGTFRSHYCVLPVGALKERINDAVESLRVKWFMLDAQAKQVVVMTCLYLVAAVIGIGQKIVEQRIEKENTKDE